MSLTTLSTQSSLALSSIDAQSKPDSDAASCINWAVVAPTSIVADKPPIKPPIAPAAVPTPGTKDPAAAPTPAPAAPATIASASVADTAMLAKDMTVYWVMTLGFSHQAEKKALTPPSSFCFSAYTLLKFSISSVWPDSSIALPLFINSKRSSWDISLPLLNSLRDESKAWACVTPELPARIKSPKKSVTSFLPKASSIQVFSSLETGDSKEPSCNFETISDALSFPATASRVGDFSFPAFSSGIALGKSCRNWSFLFILTLNCSSVSGFTNISVTTSSGFSCSKTALGKSCKNWSNFSGLTLNFSPVSGLI